MIAIKSENLKPIQNEGNNSNTGVLISGVLPVKSTEVKDPVFKTWKGEQAQEMLNVMWRVSGGNKEFVLTMLAENGTFDPYRKHPVKNRDKSWDYSFGLNSYYHKDMIDKIVAKTVSLEEIAKYHFEIYNRPDWKTSCGKKAFCGYNRIGKADVKNQIIFN